MGHTVPLAVQRKRLARGACAESEHRLAKQREEAPSHAVRRVGQQLVYGDVAGGHNHNVQVAVGHVGGHNHVRQLVVKCAGCMF